MCVSNFLGFLRAEVFIRSDSKYAYKPVFQLTDNQNKQNHDLWSQNPFSTFKKQQNLIDTGTESPTCPNTTLTQLNIKSNIGVRTNPTPYTNQNRKTAQTKKVNISKLSSVVCAAIASPSNTKKTKRLKQKQGQMEKKRVFTLIVYQITCN